ncbi:hypothetical protein KSS87_016767, partial [Heliosperma pusillum]
MITSKTHQTNSKLLNPQAPHFIPNRHFTHFTNYPLFNPLPPPQPPFFNIFYRHPIFPPFLPKTLYYYNTELPMLPATEPGCTEPPADQQSTVTRESDPESVVVRKVHKPKRRKPSRVTSSGAGMWFWSRKDVMYHPVAVAANYPFGDSTSLMIRNIPIRFSRKEVMELVDEHCRKENEKISSHDEPQPQPLSEFDFLYLPIDFKSIWSIMLDSLMFNLDLSYALVRTKGNLGYAFVNFTSWQGGARLFSSWNGSPWENCPYQTKKICQINRAKFQGKRDLRRHFEMSVFPCDTDEYLPVVILPPRNGFNADQTTLATI